MPRARRQIKKGRQRTQENRKPQDLEKKKIPVDSLFKKEELDEIAARMSTQESDEIDCLIGAVVLSKFDVLKKLLKGGYPIDSCSKDGSTALMWSIRLDIWEMVEFLVKRRSNLSIEDSDGNTALLVAVQAESWSQDTFLHFWNLVKDSPFPINHQNKLGYTVLHHVVRRQWDEAVEALLSAGADTNSVTHKGVTPIMMAASRLQVKAMRALFMRNADPLIEDKKGCTSVCYAAAFVIKKRLKEFDPVLKEIIEHLRRGTLRMSLKSYLQRRLELLQSPQVEKFHRTVSSVVVHIVTFFLHHVPECPGAFLQLNAFKSLRRALEKHLEKHNYIVSILGVVRELLRYCDCCTPHWRFDDIVIAFHDSAIPALCLRLTKRFSSNPAYQENLFDCFAPIFLACEHDRTKIWLQRNYKHIKNLYQTYLEARAFDGSESFYPDDYHRVIVENHFLHFKSLMGLLLTGNAILQDIRLPKRRNEKSPKSVDRENIKFAKENSKVGPINETIATETRKDEICLKTETNQTESTIFKDACDSCQELTTVALCKNKIVIEDKIGKIDSGKTIYPKWREEFKDGCKLFGIKTDPCELKDVEHDLNLIALSQNDQNRTVLYLDELFFKLLYTFEIMWQCDFSNGYIKAAAINDIPEFTKLMYDLPTMEAYYWLKLSEKWKHLCKHLRRLSQENRTSSIEEVEQYLNLALNSMQNKYKLLNEVKEHDVIRGLTKKYCNFCLYEDFLDRGDYQRENITIKPMDRPTLAYEPNENKKDIFSSYACQISALLSENRNTLICSGKTIYKIPPPPGFQSDADFIENTIFEENWRQVIFCKEEHYSLVCELQNLRLKIFKYFIPQSPVIFPPAPTEELYRIGEGGSLGDVFLGLDATTAKPLAIKRIPFKESLTQQMRALKICELMRRLENIQAKCIVPYTHCVQWEGCVVLATPLCQRNLKEHLLFLKKEKVFTRIKARSLAKQMMNGIYFLHTQDPPIVHGNLKPSNILIDASGRLRLSEFGIYEVLYQQLYVSPNSSMWWSRETYCNYQASWKEMISSKSDIQTCGMICHYILSAGYHPFGLSSADIERAVLASTPILRLDEPEAIDLISWMLSSSPSDRPTIQQVIMHSFNWNKAKKWRFLLVCAGIANTKLTKHIIHLNRTIIKCAQEQSIGMKLMNQIDDSHDKYKLHATNIKTLPDLFDVLRRNLPHSVKWFLSAFPWLPFTIYRLIENTRWVNHPDLTYFYHIQNWEC